VTRLTASELVDIGLASLAETFDLPLDRMTRSLVTARAINWGNDPFARGAYSMPRSRHGKSSRPEEPDAGAVFWQRALRRPGYGDGPVEAGLASGQETAQTILAGTG
jgi:hypothetical protein